MRMFTSRGIATNLHNGGLSGSRTRMYSQYPLPGERKRKELDLAELMAQTIEDILSDKTIGWEAAAELVKAIKHAYPELLEY